MEQKPHVPGYGRGEKLDSYLDREMTIEEIDAMEVAPIEVVKKGVVHSKVEALKKPSPMEQEHVRETIAQQIEAEMAKPIKGMIEKRVRDMKVQRLREKLEKIGRG